MDLRQFQDCRYFLQGRCATGGGCPFAHDEAKRQKLIAAQQAGQVTPWQPAQAATQQAPQHMPCFFFQQGRCAKGSACQFSHDLSLQGTAGLSTEAKLDLPLGAQLPAQQPRPKEDANLLVQLDASPTADWVGARLGSRQQQPPAAAQIRQPQRETEPASAGRGRSVAVSNRDEVAPGPRDWGTARPGWGQPEQPDVRRRTSSSREDGEIMERSNGAAAVVVKSPPRPKPKSTVFDRLGGLDAPRPKRMALHGEQPERSTSPLQPTRRPTSGNAAAPLRLEEPTTAKRQRTSGEAGQPRARLASRLDQPLGGGGSSSGRSAGAAAAAPARPSSRAAATAAREPAKRAMLASAAPLGKSEQPAPVKRQNSSGQAPSQPAAVTFQPPKSREELRKERERAALGKPLKATLGQNASSGGAQPASGQPAVSQAGKRVPIPSPGQQTAAAVQPAGQARKHAPIPVPGHQASAPVSVAARLASAAATVKAKTAEAAGASMAAAAPQPTSGPAQPAKAAEGPAASSGEFKWDVEGIEDAEDDFEEDLEADVDDADVDGEGGATPADDFDEDLAEFENAF